MKLKKIINSINVSKHIVQNEPASDGGLESLLFIIKHYKGGIVSFDLDKMVQQNYPLTSTPKIINVATKCGLIAVECDQIDIQTIVDYGQPVLITLKQTSNKKKYAVCHFCKTENNFLIWKSRDNATYTSFNELLELRADSKCIAFCKN